MAVVLLVAAGLMIKSVGRLIGVHALAAASSFFPIIFFMVAFFIGIASASSVLIGQAYGAHDEERLKAVAGTTLALALGSGVLIGAASWFFLPPLLHVIESCQGKSEQLHVDQERLLPRGSAGKTLWTLPLCWRPLSGGDPQCSLVSKPSEVAVRDRCATRGAGGSPVQSRDPQMPSPESRCSLRVTRPWRRHRCQ